MTDADGIHPTFSRGEDSAPPTEPPVGAAQQVSDPDDETTEPDVRIDPDAADPLDPEPVGDPDLEAPAQD